MSAMTPVEHRLEHRFATRVFTLVCVALLVWAIYRIFLPFIGPILWASLIAFLLHPLYRRLLRRLKERANLAAGLATAVVVFGMVLPIVGLATLFAGQAAALVEKVQTFGATYRIRGPADLLRLPILSAPIEWISSHSPVTMAQMEQWLVRGAEGMLRGVLDRTTDVFRGVLGFGIGLTLMLFILFFFFRDGAEMIGRFVQLLPLEEGRRERLIRYLGEVTHAVVAGSLLTALVQGALVGIGWAIVGLPSPIVFGVLAAFASLLPFVGTALIWVPGALVLGADGHWGRAAILLAWGALLVGLADNILRPYFVSGRADISTLPVFFGVIGGLAAFGTIGLFLGPVVLALALALIRFAEEDARINHPEVPAAPPPAGAGPTV